MRLRSRPVRALAAAIRADLARQHRELSTQVLHLYGVDAMHRNQAMTWNRWGW